jgi:hypothetical protein
VDFIALMLSNQIGRYLEQSDPELVVMDILILERQPGFEKGLFSQVFSDLWV